MTQLTTLEELNEHISILASTEESDALFITIYLNLEDKTIDWRDTLNERARLLRLILKNDDLVDLNNALDKAETWLSKELHPRG